MEYGCAGVHNVRTDPIRRIGELVTDKPNHGRTKPGLEGQRIAFAPDESRLAWCKSNGRVVLIPWNRYKNCLQLKDNLDEEGAQLEGDQVTIDSNFTVCSLAFGTTTPESQLVLSPIKCYWRRIDNTRHLVLATGHDNGRIRLWDPYNGRLVLELMDNTKSVSCLSFAPDGSLRLVSGSHDGTIKVWDMPDDGNMFKTFSEHKGALKAVSWSPDSKLMCSVGTKRKALIWDMVNYSLLFKLSGHNNDVLACSFSPDGATVATASADTTVIVWDTHTGEAIRTLYHMYPPPGLIYMAGSNESQVTGVAFSPHGCDIATVCADGFLRYWDLGDCADNCSEPAVQAPQDENMTDCVYSPLGATLAVGHESGNVMFYSTPGNVPSLLHLSRMSVRRSFGNIASNRSVRLPHTLRPYLQYREW